MGVEEVRGIAGRDFTEDDIEGGSNVNVAAAVEGWSQPQEGRKAVDGSTYLTVKVGEQQDGRSSALPVPLTPVSLGSALSKESSLPDGSRVTELRAPVLKGTLKGSNNHPRMTINSSGSSSKFINLSIPKLKGSQGPQKPQGQHKQQQVIKCPRCGKSDFDNARELGKHAIACRKEHEKNNPSKKGNGKTPMMMDGGERMAKLMNIKRMQRLHEEEEKNKEQQAKIDREMELLIKMEQAREKRDFTLKKKREIEERREREEGERQAQLREEKRLQKLELEKKVAEREAAKRAASIVVDEDSESDSDSDDETAMERRRKLRQEMGIEPVGEPDTGLDDSVAHDESHAMEDIDWLESPYKGYTAAHLAAYYDDVKHMAKIIELEGDVVSVDPDGRTPLHICVIYGHDGCMEQLAAIVQAHAESIAGALYDEEELFAAEQLLLTRFVDSEGKTPLHSAASVGNFAAVLLLGSADPHCLCIADLNGDSPLHTAVYYGLEDCCTILLQLGASPDGPQNYNTGKTPAAMCATQSILESLVAYGADYYGVDLSGRSVLFDACANNLVDIVSYLLSIDEANNPMIINYGDSRGDTPLHAAACNGNSQCIDLLLVAGADPHIENQAGIPPVVLALLREYQSCIDIFVKHGIDPPDEEKDDADEEAEEPGEEGGAQAVAMEVGKLLPLPVVKEECTDQESPWDKYVDEESGLSYYFNRKTSATQWECPMEEQSKQ